MFLLCAAVSGSTFRFLFTSYNNIVVDDEGITKKNMMGKLETIRWCMMNRIRMVNYYKNMNSKTQIALRFNHKNGKIFVSESISSFDEFVSRVVYYAEKHNITYQDERK